MYFTCSFGFWLSLFVWRYFNDKEELDRPVLYVMIYFYIV